MLVKSHTNNWKKQQFRLCLDLSFFMLHIYLALKGTQNFKDKKIRLIFYTLLMQIRRKYWKFYQFPVIPRSFLLTFSILSRKQVFAQSQQQNHRKKLCNMFKLTKTPELTFTYSKSTMLTLEKYMKNVLI